MRRIVIYAAAFLFVARTAAADEGNVCKDSYEQSQTLMTSSLLPARESLRTCLRAGCKEWMVNDCSKWLGEVESRIPTVVFSAKNSAGRDLTDIQVLNERGEPIAARLDGHALELEPGEQTFIFIGPDGAKRETKVLIREGQKAQNVTATFDAPPSELPPPPPPPVNQVFAPAPPSTLRYVGYGLIGTGIVGLAIGSIFGMTAISKKNSGQCDSTGGCANYNGEIPSARTASDISTIAFIAGGALLASGITAIVLSPATRSVAINGHF